MKRTTLVALAAAALVGAAVAGGLTAKLLNDRHRDALLEHGNLVAANWQIRYDSLTGAYEERGVTVRGQAEIIDQLRGVNGELADRLDDTRAEVLTLTRTVARLQAEGQTSGEADTVEAGGLRVTPRVDLHYDRSRVVLFGEVTVMPDSTYEATLGVDADLWLGTVVSRTPSGELRVDAWSDIPTLRISEIEVTDNLDDPLAPDGGGFFLFKPSTWLGVGLGLLGGLILGGAI